MIFQLSYFKCVLENRISVSTKYRLVIIKFVVYKIFIKYKTHIRLYKHTHFLKTTSKILRKNKLYKSTNFKLINKQLKQRSSHCQTLPSIHLYIYFFFDVLKDDIIRVYDTTKETTNRINDDNNSKKKNG